MAKKRSEIDDKFKWKITDLLESDELWQKEYDIALKMIEDFSRFKGTLSKSAENLFECLKASEEVSNRAEKVYVYANLRLREDTADSLYQGLSDKAGVLMVKLSVAMSFIETEILEAGEEKIKTFLNEKPELKKYTHYLLDILRLKDHILSHEMEELLSNASEIGGGPSNIFAMLNNADMDFGTVQDENGNEVKLTHGKFISLMESKNRAVRENVFKAFYKAYISHKNTLASIYNASVKKDVFFARQRKYDTAVEMSLNANNIPLEVYHNLIKAVENNLKSLHKYVNVRKRALGLDEIHMYDIYTPIVKDINTSIEFEEAKETVLKSLAPMGEEYVKAAREGMENGWLDIYENEGKDSGAFSWGTYSCHPFVLLNFDNKIDDMFTLAHEMGHAMHSFYTSNNQPYIYGDYTLFVAEVASTVNEALLMEYLLENTEDEAMKKYLINYYMEQFRGTLFRQTMFAEFELKTHEMAEKGEPLTKESLNKIYRDLNRKYYGDEIILDEEIDYEWSRIPHFYRPFYVYQYATGYSAAIAFSRRILEQGESAVEEYKGFLKSGSSDYSINILKKAGVDMSTPQPVEEALKVFASLVDKFEGFLN